MATRGTPWEDRIFAVVPYSTLFFVVAFLIYFIQWFAIPGVFLMMLGAAFWVSPIINLGLIGIALEALWGRVWRIWLLLPVAVYGAYFYQAASDHATLEKLKTQYESENAGASVRFDKTSQVLVFDGDADMSLVSDYDLPVEYRVKADVEGGYRSTRLADIGLCERVDEMPASAAAAVFVSYIGDRDQQVCAISAPEEPKSSIVRVSQVSETTVIDGLPVERTITTIVAPDGSVVKIKSGFAAPLKWLPSPYAGCALVSSGPGWKCWRGLSRQTYTPITSGEAQFGRDREAVARALGLRKLTPAERKASVTTFSEGVVEAAYAGSLAKELKTLDLALSRPEAVLDYQYWTLIWQYPENIALRSDAIIALLERRASEANDGRAAISNMLAGQLADLLAHLPPEQFANYKSRILALYSQAGPKDWLWDAEFLVARLGDLGIDALPYVSSVPALKGNYPGIEGLCRIGPPARKTAEPALTSLWSDEKVRPYHGQKLYVAMQRIGIPIPEAKASAVELGNFRMWWPDLSPKSPSSVCTGIVKSPKSPPPPSAPSP